MRTLVVLIPIAVVLLNADPGRSGASGAVSTTVSQSADTIRGKSRFHWLLRQVAPDSLGRPELQCPMPVVRPDPAAAESMPTGPTPPPRNGVWWFSGPHDVASGMPVIRSGCWNPLDQPHGGPDSALIDRRPHPRR